LNSRERVLTALNHREPDRVPFCLGGTVATMISIRTYQGVRRLLGLPEKPVGVGDIIMQMARLDDDARDILKVDTREVGPRSSYAGSRVETSEMAGYKYFHDEWGVGWRMPLSEGYYYDMFDFPLRDATSPEDVRRYPWPDPVEPARFVGLAEEVRRVHEVEKRAVVLGGLTAGVLEMAAFMMGYDNFYPALALNQKTITAIFDKVLELKLAYWERVLAECGPYVDVICEADDLAGQNGLLISPKIYRELLKPRHTELFKFIKKQAPVKIWLHSCGAVRKIIPDFIESGVDILNPVQVNAVGMDTQELKREFGKDIVFWGGGVDTQFVLPNGTPEQVREEVKRRLGDLMPGGGFVFGTVHNVQRDVPPENFLAMWETLQEFGVY
jgi:uroporphyrinogen decarboxylase